jgi:hypothetical protein
MVEVRERFDAYLLDQLVEETSGLRVQGRVFAV